MKSKKDTLGLIGLMVLVVGVVVLIYGAYLFVGARQGLGGFLVKNLKLKTEALKQAYLYLGCGAAGVLVGAYLAFLRGRR